MPLKTSAKRSLLQKNPAILVILRNNSLGPLDRVCIFGKYRKTTEIIKNRRQPVVYNGYILIYAFKLRTVSQLLRVAKKLFPYGFRLFAAGFVYQDAAGWGALFSPSEAGELSSAFSGSALITSSELLLKR